MGKFIRFVQVALLASLGWQVSGYSSGADPSVCDTMVPSHGALPQNSESPYKLTLSKTNVMGTETIDITLSAKNDNDFFKGFFIQVRKPGEEKTYGEFKSEDKNVGITTCRRPNSAATHRSSVEKKEVKAQWIAPNDDSEYEILYTVVGRNGGTFWSKITHPEKIRVTRDAQVTTTAATIKQASPELKQRWKEFYDGCGDTKGCFGMPGKCVENFNADDAAPETCDIMVTWEKRGDKNVYQLTGRSGSAAGYVALGLSTDDQMGEDSVVGCVKDGSVAVRRFHNEGKSNSLHTPETEGLENIGVGDLDGNLFCSFEQKNHNVGGLSINFDENYYLLIARSPNYGNGGPLTYHSDRAPSPQSVHISENIIMGASSKTWLVHLHGGLMVIAWLLCASTGMFTARYFKQTHTDFMPLGKAFWFALHTFCMCATAFLTICGAIFIIIYKKGFQLKEAHPILGVIVIGLAICQVIIALFRPHPGTPKRPIFNWVHWGIGNSAHIIGIACIFLAIDLPLANLKREDDFGDEYLWLWIMMSLVLFHILMHIVMSVHTLWADKQLDANNKKRAMFPGPMKPNGMSSEAPGTGFRTFMLALYLLVMAAGAVTLVILIFWPVETSEEEPTS